MAKINLFRVDTRLVHGQMVTKWRKVRGLDKIVIVDDNLAADPFMSNFYAMSAPAGTKIEIVTQDDACARWEKDQFGDIGTIGIVFKDVPNAYGLWKRGVIQFNELDLGNLVAAKGKVSICKEVFLSPEEFQMVKEMKEAGVDVYVLQAPDLTYYDWNAIASKF